MMTVTPRYQAYDDVTDTGLVVPLKLPVCGAQPGAVAPIEHQLSDDHSCQQPRHSQPAPLQAWAALYHCRQKGVDRVFVDHPLFLETFGKDNANTYLHGGSQFPNLDLQYSILCQAALAAPILLWHQPQHHLHRLQLQALARKLPRTLSGGVAHYIGLDAASASLLSPQDSWLKTTDRPPWSSCADKRSPTAARPAMLPGGIARSVPPRPASPGVLLVQPLLRQSHQDVTNFDSAGVVWPDSAGKIAFVGNDWPCFPLAQHLRRLQSIACESDRGTDAQTGLLVDNPQASAPLACLADNNFETHMARLLKSARVAFCIHNLAYQGIFAQVGFSLLHCHCIACCTSFLVVFVLLHKGHLTEVSVSFMIAHYYVFITCNQPQLLCSIREPSPLRSTVCLVIVLGCLLIIPQQYCTKLASFVVTRSYLHVSGVFRSPLPAPFCNALPSVCHCHQ